MLETRIYSSLVPVFPDKEPAGETVREFIMCSNAPLSFQMAFKLKEDELHATDLLIRIVSDLDISYYYENNVPAIHLSSVKTDYSVGLFPDILIPKVTNPKIVNKKAFNGAPLYLEEGDNTCLRAYDDSWQALWFCINENSKNLRSGVHTVKIEIYSRANKFLTSEEIVIDVLDKKLPDQKLKYTNWFHHDCLCDTYNVEVFSDRYYEIMVDYLKKATLNGMNMILLPAFTPALDTPIGFERMTVQLVKIKKCGSKYEFDFSEMKKYIDICKKCGIKYFEHCHFFTQWGAKAAPKIVADVGGKTKKIFGWDTPSTSKSYVSFLRQYICSFKEFIKGEGLDKKVIFHISDEPEEHMLEMYSAARNGIIDLLEGYPVGDAMSDVKFYEMGYCSTPIAMTGSVHDFIGKCDDLWAYYTGSNTDGGKSNRVFQIPRERNRMLGVQLYYFNIKGFLQWGFNNYYGVQSHYRFNPALNPCGGFVLAGTSYMVYPAFDGTAYQSIRLKIFGEGIRDIRLLSLLEKLCGRGVCEEIIKKHFGELTFDVAPESSKAYDDFIKEVYSTIKNA